MKKNSFTIYHNLIINASKEDIFNAVSEPEHLVNWWPQKCSGEAKLGSIYRLFFSKQYDWLAEVEKIDLNKSFHLSMIKSDDDWSTTSFGFDIIEKNEKLWLHFAHQGWQSENDHFKHSSFCWALLLNALKNYIEKGEIIPFEERA